ncbi:MAG: helix-turn-helix transcriptional regulator [Pseudomonadota bacterium]
MQGTAIYKQVGKRIAERRKDIGLIQEELAQRVGLSRASIANVERGEQKIQLHTLVDFSNALELDDVRLLFPEQNQDTDPTVRVTGTDPITSDQLVQIDEIVSAVSVGSKS